MLKSTENNCETSTSDIQEINNNSNNNTISNIPIFESERLLYYFPLEKNDLEVHKIYNDYDNMINLPFLYNLSNEDWKKRRNAHREGFLKGNSAFFDIMLKETEEIIGTSGFREINREKNEAEWGIIISKKFQGRKFCSEACNSCLDWLHKVGIKTAIASTLIDNNPMNSFLIKNEWKNIGNFINDFGEWIQYEKVL